MDESETKLREERVAKAITRLFEKLFHDLENVPKIIFGIEKQAEENEQTINEIPA